MRNKKLLQEDIQQTKVLSELMQAYEELAALRMKRVRDQVLKSREFHEILRSYFHEIRKASGQQETGKQPERHIALLVSDDKGLYGDILHKTHEAFLSFAKEHESVDLAVIGTSGGKLLQEALPQRPISVFPFADGTSHIDQMTELLTFLAAYTSATVFHGKFMSLVTQLPQMTQLTGDDLPEQEATATPSRQYIFEPSRESLLTFFQQEILTILFEETVLEGSLAKQASRMITLEKATGEAKKRLTKLKKMKRMLRVEQEDKKQTTHLAGLTLWQIH